MDELFRGEELRGSNIRVSCGVRDAWIRNSPNMKARQNKMLTANDVAQQWR